MPIEIQLIRVRTWVAQASLLTLSVLFGIFLLGTVHCLLTYLAAYVYAPRPQGLGGVAPASLSLIAYLGSGNVFSGICAILILLMSVSLVRCAWFLPLRTISIINAILFVLVLAMMVAFGYALLLVQYSFLSYCAEIHGCFFASLSRAA